MTEAPERLIVGSLIVRGPLGLVSARALSLASVPGLAATECVRLPGSWVLTHAPSGYRLSPKVGTFAEPQVAPWAAVVQSIRALRGVADWTLPADVLGPRLDGLEFWHRVPEAWTPERLVEPRRVAPVSPGS